MSFLTQTLPSLAAGCEVYTDFRAWLRFDEALKARDAVGMLSVYKELPPSIGEALRGAVDFYTGGVKQFSRGGGKAAQTNKRLYDFAEDAPLIYAAFMGQYGIDLLAAKMHWYSFCALFNGIDDNQKLSKVISWRGIDTSKIADKDKRREYKRLQRLFALPDLRTDEEIEADNFAALAEGF